jgi:hypothetical protein
MSEPSRRESLKTGFNAVVAYALFDTLFSRDAFAREIKPLTLIRIVDGKIAERWAYSEEPTFWRN